MFIFRKKKRSKSDANNRFFFGEKCSKTSVAGTALIHAKKHKKHKTVEEVEEDGE